MSICSNLISRRFMSSCRPIATKSQTHFIFGANTDVGKTVLSAGLVRATKGTTHYIKPLQCGGSDQNFVEKNAPNVASTTTLFRWETPASPHVASRKENQPVSDQQVCQALEDRLVDLSSPDSTCWIETAGGVLSPSSASPDNILATHACNKSSWGWVTQGDLYQPFVTLGSVILVGDGRLGGISATLSALESLIIRGYDIAGILLLETGYDNHSAIQEYANRTLKLRSGDGTPLFTNPEESIISLPQLPPEPEPLTEWYESQEVTETLENFVQVHLARTWKDRIARMAEEVDNHDNDDGYNIGESSTALAAAAAFGRNGRLGRSSPAMRLSKQLLEGNDWANRVLFCRDRQSATQLAVDMGVKHFLSDQLFQSIAEIVVCVQGPEGLALNNTTVQFTSSSLIVQEGVWYLSDSDESFASRNEAFDVESRVSGETFLKYKASLSREWDELEMLCQIASVYIAPSLGTQTMVDPLWYRALWEIAKSKQIPLILDGRDNVDWKEVIGCLPDLVVSEVGGIGRLGVVLVGEGIDDDNDTALPFTPSAAESISALHSL